MYTMVVTIILTVGLMTIMGCRESQNWLPLKKGNRWEYKIIAADSTEIHQVATVQSAKFDGKECIAIVHECDKPEYNYTDYFSVESTTIMMLGSIVMPGSPKEMKVQFAPEIIFLKYPLEIKASWAAKSTLSIMQTIIPMTLKVTVLQKEKVTVPAGVFDCYRLEIEIFRAKDPVEKNSYWFSNGIGVVKKVGPHATYELVSYHIKK